MTTPVRCDLCRQPARDTIDTASGTRCIRCISAALEDELRVGAVLRAHIRDLTAAPLVPKDLLPALRSVTNVLVHGHSKHRETPWRTVDRATHRWKAEGHRRRTGHCPETGQPHRAHAICRELFLLQLELEEVSS